MRLVEGFAKASPDPRLHLLFTGDPTPELLRWIEVQQVSSRVAFLGMVAEEKLPSVYRSAQAVVLASLYEGFGLPVLEGMACGVPVITSNVTAMPEVAGDAALLVDPRSVEEISQALEKITQDSVLCRQLVAKGVCRAAQFSWMRTADKVQQLLADARTV